MKANVLLIGATALALTAGARTLTSLNGEGWTLDGAPVTVPHTWNAQDAADGLGEMVADGRGDSVASPSYRRCARTYARALPDPKAGRRYFIRCEGVSVKATVRVNGREVGRHAGAFTAFCFEITSALRPSGNRLEIVADNSYDPDVPPISGDFVLFGGVYRNVWLLETPRVCVSPLVWGGPGVALDADLDTGRVTAKVTVLGGTNEVQHLAFGRPKLWSPETPHLYTARIVVRQGGCEDAVEIPFGFRKAEFRGDGFYLNGVKRQIRGVCRHQDREGKGWAVTAEDEAEDVAWMKRMGADGVRTAHYPQSEAFFDLCDRRGLMAWTELPLVEMLSFTPAFRTNALAMAREMTAQLAHHPSIVTWGIGNEIFGGAGWNMDEDKVLELVRAVRDEVHVAEPSRPVTSASCHPGRHALNTLTDIQGFNLYPGWYDSPPWYEGNGGWGLSNSIRRIFAAYSDRSTIAVSEYGAGASVTQHDDPMARPLPDLTPYPEEYQAYLHWGALAATKDDSRIWGVFPWVMFDLAADRRREADRHGINNKGLVTYDRRTAKDAFYLYKANWNPEPELHLVGGRMTETTREKVTVIAFSNVGEVTLTVNGRIVGVRKPDRVATCCWRDVPLLPGENDVAVSAGGRTARATWTRSAYHGRYVAIGFDDFRASDFKLVAPLFKKYGAKATFNRPAWRADWTETELDQIRRLEADGHEIGDHTWFHWNGPFDDPLMNGQDPAHPDGDQEPFPTNAQMRDDRGDGCNAFGFPLADSVDVQLSDFFDYGRKRWSAFEATWGKLTDAQCQTIRSYFALYGNPNGYLDVLDTLSNRYLGTTGHSRGSWDAAKGCYAGGLFTGCRSSANHAVWERIVRLTKAAYRAQYRQDFKFATWSWPGSIPSPFLFRKDGRAYYDAACTLSANTLARFASSDVGETAPRLRSWTDVLRAAGYVTTHDMIHPGRRDGAPLTMIRRELPLNAAYSRRDALAYSTSRTVNYDAIAREFAAGDYTNDLRNAARKMYDAGGSFRAFVEAVRHDTASGLVHGEVIDSEDTFSERLFLEQALRFCRRVGVRVVTRKEAHDACFGERRTCGNLIRNSDFVNSVALFVPDARTLPTNPDGYLGDCRVETMADGVRALVTAGPVTNLVCGVPPGRLTYGVRARGMGRIRIFAVRNSSPVTLSGLEELAAVSVDSAAFAPYEASVTVPDAPEGAYEPRCEGLGEKVMGLLVVYDPGLGIRNVSLTCCHEMR